MIRAWPIALLLLAQGIAAVRVFWRMARTADGQRIATRDTPLPDERITIIVPVLNERGRLGPCLEGLLAQPEEAAEILVVDGGSADGTPALVAGFMARDGRVRLVDASPVPAGWNGKAHGLQRGLEAADPRSRWILTMDADVRPAPALARSLLAHARRTGDSVLGVATSQRLSGAGEGVVHPALLTTLVYRFGIPGHATRRVREVQANGQCSLYRRAALEGIGGFRAGQTSVCEDVTVARALAHAGHATGFYEAGALVGVEMYAGWRDAWRNWTRSLPLRDHYSGRDGWLGLTEVTLTQALPLPLLLASRLARRGGFPRQLLMVLNVALVMARLGVLAGTARAYPGRPWSYWLSPLADLPVALQLWRSALRRVHSWRGRTIMRDDRSPRTLT